MCDEPKEGPGLKLCFLQLESRAVKAHASSVPKTAIHYSLWALFAVAVAVKDAEVLDPGAYGFTLLMG